MNFVDASKPKKCHSDDGELDDQFYAATKTIGAFKRYFHQVVYETNDCERNKNKAGDEDVAVSKISEE